MDSILIKILATALTFSQVATDPEHLNTQFDPAADQARVVEILQAGCAHMRKAFDIEAVNLDDLISVAMDDPETIAGGHVAFKGMELKDLQAAYQVFCKREPVAESGLDIGAVIGFYNRTLADLPDHTRLKSMKLPGTSMVLDLNGEPIAEVQEQFNRRQWIPLSEVPETVQRTFIAAEDKRFYEHKGVDESALIRAFVGNLAQSGRPQGGSTITQQVVKNLLVGEEVTYERKMREMVLASRVEATLSKAEILELYLNSIYLGRGSWGIEMAARSYFGKSANALTLAEGALLAALVKGPNYFNPDRHPARAQDRVHYVLDRLHEDGIISPEEERDVLAHPAQLAAYEPARQGSHFLDYVSREAKGIIAANGLPADFSKVRSTLNPELQKATEASLQEGLARYEASYGRSTFEGAEANLSEQIQRIESDPNRPDDKPAWQQALEGARLPLYDVHWPVGIVLPRAKAGGALQVGLADGRILPLSVPRSAISRLLKADDVVFVRVVQSRGKSERAELRVRPKVQGAAVVLENKTGRILAMAGGFSYPVSQLNRTAQSARQPGSALKPLTYLAALQSGLQPNTLVRDEDITLPPIGGTARARPEDYWSPKNYDGGGSGVITLRRALENSKNLATANLLEGGIAEKPADSLDRICAIAREAQVYKDCVRYYPFVLGAQPVRPLDLAVFYATVANEGARPTAYAIEAIEHKGDVVYRHAPHLTDMTLADHVSFYQLKTMLQGVLARGTARSLAHLAPYVAGKTGTTDGENDAWFVGFTNDVSVAIWVGYDNADGKRRTLGGGATGGGVALPIFEPIIQAVWANYAKKTPLSPPSLEAKAQMVAVGRESRRNRDGELTEYLRRDPKGRAVNAEYKLVSRRDTDEGSERRTKNTKTRTSREAATQQPAPQEGAWSSWGWRQEGSQRAQPELRGAQPDRGYREQFMWRW